MISILERLDYNEEEEKLLLSLEERNYKHNLQIVPRLKLAGYCDSTVLNSMDPKFQACIFGEDQCEYKHTFLVPELICRDFLHHRGYGEYKCGYKCRRLHMKGKTYCGEWLHRSRLFNNPFMKPDCLKRKCVDISDFPTDMCSSQISKKCNAYNCTYLHIDDIFRIQRVVAFRRYSKSLDSLEKELKMERNGEMSDSLFETMTERNFSYARHIVNIFREKMEKMTGAETIALTSNGTPIDVRKYVNLEKLDELLQVGTVIYYIRKDGYMQIKYTRLDQIIMRGSNGIDIRITNTRIKFSPLEIDLASIICTGNGYNGGIVHLRDTPFFAILCCIHTILVGKYLHFIDSATKEELNYHKNAVVKSYIINKYMLCEKKTDFFTKTSSFPLAVDDYLTTVTERTFRHWKRILVDIAFNGAISCTGDNSILLERVEMLYYLNILKESGHAADYSRKISPKELLSFESQHMLFVEYKDGKTCYITNVSFEEMRERRNKGEITLKLDKKLCEILSADYGMELIHSNVPEGTFAWFNKKYYIDNCGEGKSRGK